MDIVFCCNNSYVRHMGVTMISIMLTNHSSSTLSFHVLHKDILDTEKKKLDTLAKKYGHIIHFYNVAKHELSSLKSYSSYITEEANFKLLIHEELSHIKKVLYLDVDILVANDLSTLWSCDISAVFAGVVLDTLTLSNTPYLEKIGLGTNDKYFNAGVLLLNLDLIRRQGRGALYKEIIEKIISYSNYVDQDILNIAFQQNCLWLPVTYNMTMAYFSHPNYRKELTRRFPQMATSMPEYLKNPTIVHYTGPVKPWSLLCFKPKSYLYKRYLRISPWHSPLKNFIQSLQWDMKFTFKRYLLKLGKIFR